MGRRSTRRSKTIDEKIIKERHKEERAARAIPISAKSKNQRHYLAALERGDAVVIAEGAAGTGKTYIAASWAANQYLKGECDLIILTRPYIGLGKDTGSWPGTIREKLDPYFRPMTNTLIERLGRSNYESLIEKSIELQPLQAIRGSTFNNAIIVVDEAQNTSREEVRALVTRIGENSQMIFCGDTSQSDIKGGQSGLPYLVKVIQDNKIPNCSVITFLPEDSVRSGTCKAFVEAFDKEGALK